jgi:putative sigma-54 modulation protein
VRIQITGRHVGVTEAMKDYAREKVEKLEKFYGRATTVEVTMDSDHDKSIVEIVASVGRHVRLVGKAESPDMYAAVDLAEEKLARQLQKHKEKLTEHHRGDASIGTAMPGAPRPAAGPGEETYEDVIDRMKDEE